MNLLHLSNNDPQSWAEYFFTSLATGAYALWHCTVCIHLQAMLVVAMRPPQHLFQCASWELAWLGETGTGGSGSRLSARHWIRVIRLWVGGMIDQVVD